MTCLGGGKKKCVKSFFDAKTISYTLPHFTQRKVTGMLHVPKLIYQDCRKVRFRLSGSRLHQSNAHFVFKAKFTSISSTDSSFGLVSTGAGDDPVSLESLNTKVQGCKWYNRLDRFSKVS